MPHPGDVGTRQTMNMECLYSTVKNVSGKAKTFGFLPPHGRKLAANEEFTAFGDIRQAIASLREGGRNAAQRDIVAFEAAVERGDLEIVSTPSPVLEDGTTGASKMLSLDNGTLATADPCWYSSIAE